MLNRRDFVKLAPLSVVPAASILLKKDGEAPIELDISVVKLQPGDALVLSSDNYLTADAAARIKSYLNDVFPGVKAIVLDKGLKIDGVLRA